MVALIDRLPKLLRYSQMVKILERDNLNPGDRFSIDRFGYVVMNRVDDTQTSTRFWIVKKIGTNKIVVVFGSTKTMISTILDSIAHPCKFKFTDLPNIYVNNKISKLYDRLRSKMIDNMVKYIDHSDRITMVGHGICGGLVTLAMIDSLDQFPDSTISGYTFGSPKVLMGKSAKIINNLFDFLIRSTNNNDCVSNSPWGFWYKHMGETYEFHPSTPINGFLKYHIIDAYIDMIHRAILRGKL